MGTPLAVARFLLAPKKRTPQETVILTEAAHGIIVSSAAEKSASLPPPFANSQSALVVAFALFLPLPVLYLSFRSAAEESVVAVVFASR